MALNDDDPRLQLNQRHGDLATYHDDALHEIARLLAVIATRLDRLTTLAERSIRSGTV